MARNLTVHVNKLSTEKKCPHCGKEFSCCTPSWVYKRMSNYFCSYTCWRSDEKEQAEAKYQRKKTAAHMAYLRKKNELRTNNC